MVSSPSVRHTHKTGASTAHLQTMFSRLKKTDRTLISILFFPPNQHKNMTFDGHPAKRIKTEEVRLKPNREINRQQLAVPVSRTVFVVHND